MRSRNDGRFPCQRRIRPTPFHARTPALTQRCERLWRAWSPVDAGVAESGDQVGPRRARFRKHAGGHRSGRVRTSACFLELTTLYFLLVIIGGIPIKEFVQVV